MRCTGVSGVQWVEEALPGLHKIICFAHLMFVFIKCSVDVRKFFHLIHKKRRKACFLMSQKLFLWLVSVAETLFLWQIHLFGFLCVNSQGKFPWEVGVSIISDNRDNNFVEPWALQPIPAWNAMDQAGDGWILVLLKGKYETFIHLLQKQFIYKIFVNSNRWMIW